MSTNTDEPIERPANPKKIPLRKRMAHRLGDFIWENQNKISYVAGSATGIAFTLFVIRKYNPSQPIPWLGLSEDEIMKEILSGITVTGYLNDRELVKDFSSYMAEFQKAINAAGADSEAVKAVLGKADTSLLSHFKLDSDTIRGILSQAEFDEIARRKI